MSHAAVTIQAVPVEVLGELEMTAANASEVLSELQTGKIALEPQVYYEESYKVI